jgi:hydroxyisourate hydrolase
MSAITTHVLDTAEGHPAAGVAVELAVSADQGWLPIGTARTDADGRVAEIGPATAAAGRYRLVFATGEYFALRGRETFFPEVAVTFTIAAATQHYHVPLLLSPFAFSVYRGS